MQITLKEWLAQTATHRLTRLRLTTANSMISTPPCAAKAARSNRMGTVRTVLLRFFWLSS